MKQQKWIIWIICGAILFGAGFWYTKGQDPVTKESNFQASVSESSAPAGDTSKPVNTDSSEIAVFICGAVKHPGVYRFSESVRICVVIASAGGLTKKADTNAVNQARFVQDGEQIEIPRRSKTAKDQPRAESDAQTASATSSDKISLNKATKEQLLSLPGIGESKANAIVAYRTEHGSFQKIEDIMNISGIKNGVFDKIKNKITI